MIQVSTVLKVIDNSGVQSVKCIKILGGSYVKTAGIGDLLVVTVKEIRPKYSNITKLKKGSICYAILVRAKKNFISKDGSFFFFNTNAVFLVDKNRKPIGTRLVGLIMEELRRRKLMKSLSLSAQFF